MTIPLDIPRNGRFLCSLVVPFPAVTLQNRFWDLIKQFIFFLFDPAVFVSSWLGGFVGGVFATDVSVALIAWFFIEPASKLAQIFNPFELADC